ncbi:MAG: hypothetical protein ACREAE_07975 [Nitrosopumilaceae archaeon]
MSNTDKFCFQCGRQIKLVQDVGDVIEDDKQMVEMKPITESVQDDSFSKSHIGKKDGEWLERTVNNIFLNANFQTKREYSVPIIDGGSDVFKIDVLADNGTESIFAECKDYQSKDKIPEKIIFEFIGQLNSFRKTQNRRVVGLLAVSSVDEGQYSEFKERLRQEDAVLWDGRLIDQLEKKRAELGNNKDFYNYLAIHLNINTKRADKDDNTVKYRVRFAFNTIDPSDYIGGNYDPLQILSTVEKKLPAHVNRAYYKQDKNSTRLSADYIFTYDNPNLAKQEKKGFLARLMSKDPHDELLQEDVELVKDIIKKTYGVSKDKRNKIEHIEAREDRD